MIRSLSTSPSSSTTASSRRATTRSACGRATTSGRAACRSGCRRIPPSRGVGALDYFGQLGAPLQHARRAPVAAHRGGVGRAGQEPPAPPSASGIRLQELDDRCARSWRRVLRSPGADRLRAAPAGAGELDRRAPRRRRRHASAGFARAAAALDPRALPLREGRDPRALVGPIDVLATGAGVCQDFAHLLLGMVRMRGMPGRYVSGLPRARGDRRRRRVEEVIGGQASHAWAEMLVPGRGLARPRPDAWASRSGSQHIRVAYGRDYGDVAPVRGVYKGHAGQRLSVDVRRAARRSTTKARNVWRRPPPHPMSPDVDRSRPRNSSSNSSNDDVLRVETAAQLNRRALRALRFNPPRTYDRQRFASVRSVRLQPDRDWSA